MPAGNQASVFLALLGCASSAGCPSAPRRCCTHIAACLCCCCVLVLAVLPRRSPLDPAASQYDWGGDADDADSLAGLVGADPLASMMGETLDPDDLGSAAAAAGLGVYAGPRRVLGPGELFGEISFFTEIPQMETVRWVVPGAAARGDQAQFPGSLPEQRGRIGLRAPQLPCPSAWPSHSLSVCVPTPPVPVACTCFIFAPPHHRQVDDHGARHGHRPPRV